MTVRALATRVCWPGPVTQDPHWLRHPLRTLLVPGNRQPRPQLPGTVAGALRPAPLAGWLPSVLPGVPGRRELGTQAVQTRDERGPLRGSGTARRPLGVRPRDQPRSQLLVSPSPPRPPWPRPPPPSRATLGDAAAGERDSGGKEGAGNGPGQDAVSARPAEGRAGSRHGGEGRALLVSREGVQTPRKRTGLCRPRTRRQEAASSATKATAGWRGARW